MNNDSVNNILSSEYLGMDIEVKTVKSKKNECHF